MTREELLSVAKPILFNTDMVRASLDGRKTATRRLVKRGKKSTPEYHGRDKFYGIVDHLNNDYKHQYAGFYNDNDVFYVDGKEYIDAIYFKAPYHLGDILYVRETWTLEEFYDDEALIRFKAGGEIGIDYECEGDTYNKLLKYADSKWIPSLFMPKEAARIFLKVKDVRVERLQDITPQEAWKEGARCKCLSPIPDCAGNKTEFVKIWDSTIKKSDLAKYGWDANPWVWVIEFERCEKPQDSEVQP